MITCMGYGREELTVAEDLLLIAAWEFARHAG